MIYIYIYIISAKCVWMQSALINTYYLYSNKIIYFSEVLCPGLGCGGFQKAPRINPEHEASR